MTAQGTFREAVLLTHRRLQGPAILQISSYWREGSEITVNRWRLAPSGSEGQRKAEVTLGGISSAALSSRRMEVKAVPGLYAIGEAVDVTNWLGGCNFQWAWSSDRAAGNAI